MIIGYDVKSIYGLTSRGGLHRCAPGVIDWHRFGRVCETGYFTEPIFARLKIRSGEPILQLRKKKAVRKNIGPARTGRTRRIVRARTRRDAMARTPSADCPDRANEPVARTG